MVARTSIEGRSDSRAWLIPVLVLLATWGVSSLIGYFHSDADLSGRITVVETLQKAQTDNEQQRLNRLEGKVDKLDDKFDRLFYEMTGKKP